MVLTEQEDQIQDHTHIDYGHTHFDTGHDHSDSGHSHDDSGHSHSYDDYGLYSDGKLCFRSVNIHV